MDNKSNEPSEVPKMTRWDTLKEKYGDDYFKEIGHNGGKKGGRPRSLTYDEMKSRGLLSNINFKGGSSKLDLSLIEDLF